MILVLEEDFLDSIIADLALGKDCWIVFQNMKWNVDKVSYTPCSISSFGQ